MKCYDYWALVYDGAVYCTECLPDGITEDSDEVSPIWADSEYDSYPVCDRCQYEHTYVSLTEEGQRQEYLRAEPECIRELRIQPDDKLPGHVYPGCYPVVYLTECSQVLCCQCASGHTDKDDPICCQHLHMEGLPLECDGCGIEVESAYGDPDEGQ